MKRTWITVKRGLLEPKHRFALGELVWLFIYILDRTNWEAGTIEEWLDRGAAEEMEMPIETLRDQRRKLETKGYITCERKQKGIRIIVHNWTNPKEYTGRVYNKKSLSDTPSFTPDCTPDLTPDFKSPEENVLSSYNQKSKVISQKKKENIPPTFQGDMFVTQVYAGVTTFVSIPGDQGRVITTIEALRSKYKTVKEMVEYLKPFYQSYITRRGKDGRFYQKTGHGWLDWAVVGEIPPDGNRQDAPQKKYVDSDGNEIF